MPVGRSMLRRLAEEGIRRGMFPAAAVYASRGGRAAFHEAFGRLTWEPCARPVRTGDLFDLASLTKLVTATVVLRLVERGALRLDARVSAILPEVAEPWTVADLLAHRTGATADLLGLAVRRGIRPCEPGQEAALWAGVFACRRDVELAEGTSHYSDVDFLLAQAVCERATGRGLAALVRDHVAAPLGLGEMGFCPGEPARCVPTEVDERWRGRLVVGEVHDEMAATLGGVAGHAGLFAPAWEVGRFGEAWLGLGEAPLLGMETRRLALARHSDHFALGWRRCDGSFFPSLARHGAVGHLGFTGTSLFLFPRQGAVLVVLTNRVHPRRDAAPSRLPLLARMAGEVVAWAEAR